jgi:hypothetical protein
MQCPVVPHCLDRAVNNQWMIIEPKIGTPNKIDDPLRFKAIEDDIDLPARPWLGIEGHQSLVMRGSKITLRMINESSCVPVHSKTVFIVGHLSDPWSKLMLTGSANGRIDQQTVAEYFEKSL